MKIEVDSVIRIEQPPQELITWCSNQLVMAPPVEHTAQHCILFMV